MRARERDHTTNDKMIGSQNKKVSKRPLLGLTKHGLQHSTSQVNVNSVNDKRCLKQCNSVLEPHVSGQKNKLHDKSNWRRNEEVELKKKIILNIASKKKKRRSLRFVEWDDLWRTKCLVSFSIASFVYMCDWIYFKKERKKERKGSYFLFVCLG